MYFIIFQNNIDKFMRYLVEWKIYQSKLKISKVLV